MLSFRYIYRLILAFINKFKVIIVVSVGLGILFFILVTFFIPGLNATTTTIGLVGRYTIDTLPEEIVDKISKGLTKIDENGNPMPDVAKSWETIDGGKTWIFELDSNLVWHDENSLKAKDINYEFSDASIEYVDNDTIKFNLQNIYSAFPSIVSKPVFKKGLVGLGEFSVYKANVSGGYVQKITLRDKAHNKLIYRFYPTEERAILGFKLGEVDILRNIQTQSQLFSWKTVEVGKEVEYNNIVVLFFNNSNEKFKDKDLRQALTYALDKENLGEVRAYSPISPLSWAYNPQVKKYAQDKNKAKDIKDLSIKISSLPNLIPTAEKISNQWKEYGINAEIEATTTIPTTFDVFLATVNIPKDPDQYSLWHSTQESTNISRFNNARIDKLLEDGRTEIDKETRKKIYLDFQRFLVEDVPAIFLYHPTIYTIIRK